jgi:hypothetical protein
MWLLLMALTYEVCGCAGLLENKRNSAKVIS